MSNWLGTRLISTLFFRGQSRRLNLVMTGLWRVGPTAWYDEPFSALMTCCDNSLQAFEKHTKNFYASEAFKNKERDSRPFFDAVRDYVFGRTTNLQNAVSCIFIVPRPSPRINADPSLVECKPSSSYPTQLSTHGNRKIYDFMNTQLVHNKTYAYRLPPTLIKQARSLANFHENGVFSDKEIGGIGNSTSFPLFIVSPKSNKTNFFSFSCRTYPHAHHSRLSRTHCV